MVAVCLNEIQCDEIAEKSLIQQIDRYLKEEKGYGCNSCLNVRVLNGNRYCSCLALNGDKLILLKKEYYDCEGWEDKND